mmetsp:Transcript_58070/g.126135  ORF Transcript_58070/g.126135 Transcript_58070/m.126135 type:complete len:234 (-) Transcript_58070:372-1073(-)
MHSFACSLPLALLFLCSSCASSVVAPSEASLTFVNKVASKLNCKLIIKATGPAYRLELHSLKLLPGSERHDQPSLLGYSDGFTLPTGAVHLESIQFRRYTGYWGNSGRGRQSSRYAAVPRAGSYGLGLLLSVAVFCWINECDPFGCKRAQLLAIMDEPKQHKILVRYYRRLGFKPLRTVDDSLGSFPDALVWGGSGTLMEVEVGQFLALNGPKLEAVLSTLEDADDAATGRIE